MSAASPLYLYNDISHSWWLVNPVLSWVKRKRGHVDQRKREDLRLDSKKDVNNSRANYALEFFSQNICWRYTEN